MLQSICQQICKTQQWPQDWKTSVFIPIAKKGNAKKYSNYYTIALISHTRKVMLKILQAMLQKYMNHEHPYVQAAFRKAREPRDQMPTSVGSSKKTRESHKKHLFLLYWLCQRLMTVWITTNCGKFFRDGNTRSPDLPPKKSVCRSGSNS